MPYCQECGTEVEHEWAACPKCGFRLKNNTISLTKPAPIVNISDSPKENNTYGIESLVFGILGFFLMPVIGPILAIAFGIKGKDRDDNPTYAKVGFVLGILGVIGWIVIILVILTIFGILGMLWGIL